MSAKKIIGLTAAEILALILVSLGLAITVWGGKLNRLFKSEKELYGKLNLLLTFMVVVRLVRLFFLITSMIFYDRNAQIEP